jgi:hypothetical protein
MFRIVFLPSKSGSWISTPYGFRVQFSGPLSPTVSSCFWLKSKLTTEESNILTPKVKTNSLRIYFSNKKKERKNLGLIST